MAQPMFVMIIMAFVVALSTTLAFPIAKPGCEDRCGDVRIPYPFGIKEGCYFPQDKKFLLECNPSSSTPVQPSFAGTNLNITSILLEGQLRILNYVSHDCYNRSGSRSLYNNPRMNVNPPFIFNSTANKFTVIGCDTYAYVRGMTDRRRYTTGCMSICDKMRDVEDGSCSGIGCCQTSIPVGASGINITMGSYEGYTNFTGLSCSHAFVVENDAFQFYAKNLTNFNNVISLPVVVNWVLENKSCREAADACGGNSMCVNVEQTPEDPPLGYRCVCKQGYEGNPYLPQGCQDIDECKYPDRYPNPKNAICVNTVGNYTYNCYQGYHYDAGDGSCIINHKRNIWPIIIGVGTSVGGMSLLSFFVCLYFELMRRKRKSLRSEEFFRKNGGLILQQKLSREGSYTTKIFSYEELQNATNNFDDSKIIGRGGFGTVFKGELMDNKTVAIKKSRGVDEHQVEQFINEVMLLSQINSRNVVKLLGCCLETEAPLLVFEFISNGTLFEHLHNNVKAANLSWNIRLRIASEVAGVLSYLHSVASPPIIHRDIKSDNILIDHNYTAKVSDFGISRLVALDDDQVATMVQGTLGYLDPEYMQTGLLTEKSDVYSFGIVLIELLTGRKVLASNKPEEEKFLSNGFLSSLKGDSLARVLDSSICCDENMEQLKEVSEIAKRCIEVRGEDRPCMKDVERELEVLGKKGKQVSVEVFEIDTSKTESGFEIQSEESSTSTGQYSVSFITMDQPLLPISDGR